VCALDNCVQVPNASQADGDGDAVGDVCDRCPALWDAHQSDLDQDGQGDRCDVNDGVITVAFDGKTLLTWDAEGSWSRWNIYRGDLAALRAGGDYTQTPGSNALADRWCRMIAAALSDATSPGVGAAAFYLVTGRLGGTEGDLGVASGGVPRPNAHPCP
jgi:hypothetical protein